MRRFFADRIEDGIAHFGEEEAVHINRVLRMKPGETLIVPEGRGEWLCELMEDGRTARLMERRGCCAEPTRSITLYAAYTKADKLELCTQKAVELGMSRVVPFISSRCVRVPDEKSAAKAHERLVRIAHEAVKQCGRAADAEIGGVIDFDGLIERIAKHSLSVFAYENADAPLKGVLGTEKDDIALIIGPEGGFTESEAERIRAAGAVTVSLGTRILRAETAAIALMAIAAYETGC